MILDQMKTLYYISMFGENRNDKYLFEIFFILKEQKLRDWYEILHQKTVTNFVETMISCRDNFVSIFSQFEECCYLRKFYSGINICRYTEVLEKYTYYKAGVKWILCIIFDEPIGWFHNIWNIFFLLLYYTLALINNSYYLHYQIEFV